MVFARKQEIEQKDTDFAQTYGVPDRKYYIKEFVDIIGKILQLN